MTLAQLLAQFGQMAVAALASFDWATIVGTQFAGIATSVVGLIQAALNYVLALFAPAATAPVAA